MHFIFRKYKTVRLANNNMAQLKICLQ